MQQCSIYKSGTAEFIAEGFWETKKLILFIFIGLKGGCLSLSQLPRSGLTVHFSKPHLIALPVTLRCHRWVDTHAGVARLVKFIRYSCSCTTSWSKSCLAGHGSCKYCSNSTERKPPHSCHISANECKYWSFERRINPEVDTFGVGSIDNLAHRGCICESAACECVPLNVLMFSVTDISRTSKPRIPLRCVAVRHNTQLGSHRALIQFDSICPIVCK